MEGAFFRGVKDDFNYQSHNDLATGVGGEVVDERLRDTSNDRDDQSQCSNRRNSEDTEGNLDEFDLPTIPDDVNNLTEVAGPPPVENPDSRGHYRHHNLEERTSRPSTTHLDEEAASRSSRSRTRRNDEYRRLLRRYTVLAYLALFAILGTLARIGLEDLTEFPLTPITTVSVWANLAGCIIIGILEESIQLGRVHVSRKRSVLDASNEGESKRKKGAMAPLYIGLVTGFCGSLTSFSTFTRDIFLALAGDSGLSLQRETGSPHLANRGIGGNVLALLGVAISTTLMSIGGVKAGGHLVIFGRKYATPVSRRWLLFADVLACVTAPLAWATVITLAALSPMNQTWAVWRGEILFALAFAPLGCLLRFYLSIHLNARLATFPLGTFMVNTVGSALFAMAWDLQHSSFIGLVGAQVLQGTMDGFCGAFTTVSTWAIELITLEPNHAYRYGMASVVLSMAFWVVVAGTMRWTIGWNTTYAPPY